MSGSNTGQSGAIVAQSNGKALAVKTPADQFRAGFSRIAPQIKAALPAHVTFEKFERVAMMAVQRDPKLLDTDQRTLFLELQKCAADGLLPDGRQAVMVRRWNSKLGKEAATYQPMVAGLRILMRNSGEVAALHAQVVYEGEPFRIVLGDEERIEHERILDCVNDAKIIGAYAVATLKDGEKVREFMTWSEIEKVRNVNKDWAKGPWATWKAEMARKSCVRRLYKSVPQSTDRDGERIRRAVERVDDIEGTALETEAMPSIEARLPSKLDALEDMSGEIVDEDGVITDDAPQQAQTPLDKATLTAEALIKRFADAEGAISVMAIIDDETVRKQRDWLKEKRPELSVRVEAAVSAAFTKHRQSEPETTPGATLEDEFGEG